MSSLKIQSKQAYNLIFMLSQTSNPQIWQEKRKKLYDNDKGQISHGSHTLRVLLTSNVGSAVSKPFLPPAQARPTNSIISSPPGLFPLYRPFSGYPFQLSPAFSLTNPRILSCYHSLCSQTSSTQKDPKFPTSLHSNQPVQPTTLYVSNKHCQQNPSYHSASNRRMTPTRKPCCLLTAHSKT